MRRTVDHAAMAISGYVEPWTGHATERLVSCSSLGPVDETCVRALDRDGMPVVDWAVRRLANGAQRAFSQGSFLSLAVPQNLSRIAFELLLTRNSGRRVLLDAGAFSFLIEEGDRLICQAQGEEALIGILPTNQWLALNIGPEDLVVTALDPFKPFALSAPLTVPQPEQLVLCSDAAESMPTLNCRIARITLETETDCAVFDFPTLFTAEPLVASGLSLTCHNNPTFCVRSARWDGSSLDPRLTPTHYDAIHCHDTDMAGLYWPADFAIDIPADARSGVYAIEMVCGDAIERLPFFVSAREPQSSLLFVAPTATYLAYADEYLPPHLYEWVGTDRGHQFARDNDLRSLYDYHSDASGVSLASTRRPKATLRDDYRYPLCGGPHLLPVDLHFLRFAARAGIALDLTTDHDLNRHGIGLLADYKGVFTGSHPEYLSVRMEGAYRAYISAGGYLAYMGGNGFAAAVAFKDDLMELRRGPTQPGRTWDGPLGEMALALTNEPGGYLRDRGRGEFSLTGVGIALMGFSTALPFTRTTQSRDAAVSWIFEGMTGTSFGHSGIVLGGAAGYEVDNTNASLGTPDGIVVLATATGFSDDYVDDPGRWYEGGEAQRQSRRIAEMTYWAHPSGGAVFSASSVCFLGALPGPDEQNDVGRLTANLLAHFSS